LETPGKRNIIALATPELLSVPLSPEPLHAIIDPHHDSMEFSSDSTKKKIIDQQSTVKLPPHQDSPPTTTTTTIVPSSVGGTKRKEPASAFSSLSSLESIVVDPEKMAIDSPLSVTNGTGRRRRTSTAESPVSHRSSHRKESVEEEEEAPRRRSTRSSRGTIRQESEEKIAKPKSKKVSPGGAVGSDDRVTRSSRRKVAKLK
jgi:hypothetical protein